MTSQAANFIGGIPAKYDHGLGPHLFADYGLDPGATGCSGQAGHVLEIAGGTEFDTRLLREALPASAHLVASDLNSPMLEIAREKFAGTERVEF